MSHRTFHRWLMEIAVGWLGLSECNALAARMTTILAGYEGRCAMLRMTFGSGDESSSAAKTSARPMSKELFDALWA